MWNKVLRRRAMIAAAAAVVGLASLPVVMPALRASPSTAAPYAALGFPSDVPGVTVASDPRRLAFAGPGIISQVLVKDGDVIEGPVKDKDGNIVKQGTLLATQDDSTEQAQAKVMRIDAESDSQINAAIYDEKSKEVELHRTEKLYRDILAQGRSNTEIDKARVDVEIGKIAVDFRKQEKDQNKLKLGAQQVLIEHKRLYSPIAGVVAKVDIHPGEGTDISKPAITVVQNDPLWVEANLPNTLAKVVSVGREMQVRYPDEEKWVTAKVIFASPVADPASDTRMIRMELPNPDRRPSGLPILLKLPTVTASAR